MEIIIVIILVLVFSRLLGEIVERVHLPAVIGEVAAGIILGPTALGWIDPEMEGFRVLIDIGLFFLVFTSGLEFSLIQIKKASRESLPISFMGNNIAFFSGLIMAILMGYDFETGIFIGAAFSLTALAVALRVLSDIKKEDTLFGRVVITSAVYDDLFSMFILGLVFSIASPSKGVSAGIIVNVGLRIALFLAIIYIINSVFRWRY